MRSFKSFALALCSLLAVVAFGGTASAQATRTWVSGVGDDVNPCSRTAPCKTFAGAISKTAAGGEISVLDPGGFGAVTITKSISIVADGSEGSILGAGTNGIIINAAATDIVNISGLYIEGAVTGINGIRVLSAGSVYVTDTKIRGFRGTSAPGGRGISLENATVPVRMYLRNVEINGNNVGVYVHAGTSAGAVFLDNCTIEANVSNSVYADTATSAVALVGSRLAATPMFLSNGAQAVSTGNNFIAGGVGPTTVVPLR